MIDDQYQIVDIGRFDAPGKIELVMWDDFQPVDRARIRSAVEQVIEERGLRLNALNPHIVVDERFDSYHRRYESIARAEVVERAVTK